MKNCQGCGKKIPKATKFCTHCGEENAVRAHVSSRKGKARTQKNQQVPDDFKSIIKLIYQTTKQNFLRRLPISITIGVSVWVVHTYLLVFVNEGWNPGSSFIGNFLALSGQALSGIVVSTVLAMLISSILMRGEKRKKGPGLKARINAVGAYLTDARNDAYAVLIAGIGMTVILGSLITHSASFVLAIGLGAMLASRMGSVLALLFRSLWNAAFGLMRSDKIKHYSMAAGYTGIAGSFAGSALNVVFSPGIIIGLAALGVAAAMSYKSGRTGTAASFIFSILGIGAYYFGDVSMVLADDGGWAESGSSFPSWVASTGAVTAVIYGIPPAIAASVGATLGPVMNDIANALPDSLLDDPDDGSSEGGGSGDETEDNTPPAIELSDGHRLETNENGEYWGPDENGNWRWLSREDALRGANSEQQQAAEAAREEEETERAAREEEAEERKRAEQYERERLARFERGARDDMDRSRQSIQEKNEQERQEEQRANEAAERDRQERDRLDEGITTAISGLPDDDGYRGLAARLEQLQADGDNEGMRALWKDVKGKRQAQIDKTAQEAQAAKEEADRAGRMETVAAYARDGSKIVLQGGLAAASGGTYSAAQAFGAAAVGTGALTGIGAIEQGLKEKGGNVKFDGWEATKGAARGGLDAMNSMVGGIAANGSRAAMAGKAAYAGTSAYGRTYADTYDKTGDHELAQSRASMSSIAAVAGSFAGDAFDDRTRQSQQRAAGLDADKPAGWGQQAWATAEKNAAAAEQIRIDAAKKAANIMANTLGNIASADQDKDATFGQAFGKAVKGEAAGFAAGKVIKTAGTGQGAAEPLTPKQQAVIDRLNAERTGTTPGSKVRPEYTQSMATPKAGAADTEADTGPTGASVDPDSSRARTLSGRADASETTPAQQRVIDRLNAERAGTAPQPEITPEYAAHLAGREKAAGSTIPDGDRGDFTDAPVEAGYTGGFTTSAQRHAQRVADDLGVKISVRTVGAEVAAELDSGSALPKGPKIKANTGKDVDIELGMDPANKNRVVIFDPELPPRGNRTDTEWEGLQSRLKMRQEQVEAYRDKIQKSEEFEMRGQLVVDTKTGKPFVGDADVFAITGLHGEPVPKAVSDEVMRRLIRNPDAPGQNINSMVEHGQHMGWEIGELDNTKTGPDGKTEYQRAVDINNRILAGIRPGKEPLATFSGRPGMASPQVGAAHYSGTGPKTERSDDG